jgi:hypothetical protein
MSVAQTKEVGLQYNSVVWYYLEAFIISIWVTNIMPNVGSAN